VWCTISWGISRRVDPIGAAADHIAAWEAAHLIDPETAARLRAAEAAGLPPTMGHRPAPASSEADGGAGFQPLRSAGGLAVVFGPGVSVGEMFGYVGGAFLLGAWIAFVNRIGAGGTGGDLVTAAGAVLGAIVLAGLAGGSTRAPPAGVERPAWPSSWQPRRRPGQVGASRLPWPSTTDYGDRSWLRPPLSPSPWSVAGSSRPS
jgi:hypothetical protein